MRLSVCAPLLPLSAEVDDGALAERLRAEAEALGVTTRRLLLQRARAAGTPEPERPRKVLHQLCFLTDLTGGADVPAIAPAPLRAVNLAPDCWLLVGGPRTAHLNGEVRAPFLRVMTNASSESLAQVLEPHGGRVLEPELFFESTARLDALWLAQHSESWERQAQALPALDDTPWQAFDPSLPREYHEGRWRSPRAGDQGFFLIRRRRVGERPEHAWGRLSRKQLESAFPLASPVACEVRYALDRSQGNPVRAFWHPTGSHVELYPANWLPPSEHRLLRALARHAPDGYAAPWVLDADLAELVQSSFTNRLGIRWVEGRLCPTV